MCATCRGPSADGYPHCRQCWWHRRTIGRSVADVVIPVAYAIRGRQHAHNLFMYKREHPDQQRASVELFALLYCFFAEHVSCFAGEPDADPPSVVTVVPSTKQRPGAHPLRRIVDTALPGARVELLANTEIPGASRELHRDWFSVTADHGVSREGTVLVIDDTWTTGSRIQSASYALKRFGYTRVLALVLGRWLNPGWHETPRLLARLDHQVFRLDDCANHGKPGPTLFDQT